MTLTNVTTENVRFQSGTYRLEGELHYPDAVGLRGAVVLANPHPLLGGDMRNNVVQNLASGLAPQGWAVLQFNYRGVGSSEGPEIDVERYLVEFVQTSHVADELDLRLDVAAAFGFVREVVGPELPVVGIGYSFGCALLPGNDWSALVLVAPTVARHDYEPWRAVTRPKIVIASEDDFATDAATLRKWFANLPEPKQLIQRQLDNHFFRGHEQWLVEVIADFLIRTCGGSSHDG